MFAYSMVFTSLYSFYLVLNPTHLYSYQFLYLYLHSFLNYAIFCIFIYKNSLELKIVLDMTSDVKEILKNGQTITLEQEARKSSIHTTELPTFDRKEETSKNSLSSKNDTEYYVEL